MKDFLSGLFYPSKHEKVKDNVLLLRIGVSFSIIVVCMFAMAFAAYGYFSTDIPISLNTIKSSRYTVDISGKVGKFAAPAGDGEENSEISQADTITPTAASEIVVHVPASVAQYKIGPGDYTFILKKTTGPDIASTGYCKIVFNGKYKLDDSPDLYYTQQIGKIDENTFKNFRYIHVTTTTETIVDFVPSWGDATYSGVGFDETAVVLSPQATATQTEQSGTPDNDEQPALPNKQEENTEGSSEEENDE